MMNYFRNTTDASNLFYPNAASGTVMDFGTAVSGNLADSVRNSTTFRDTSSIPTITYVQVETRRCDSTGK